MHKSYKILKVRDKTDNYYTPIDTLFDVPFRILINGKSQLSGKTTIILNLLLNPQFGYDKLFDGHNIYIITNNKLDNKLKMMMEKLDIPDDNHMEYDEEMLTMLYDQLEEQFHEEVEEDGKPSNKLIIMDDIGYSGQLRNYKKENIIDKLICNGRHANISQIYTSQKFTQTSTCLRTNISGAILFGTNAKELDAITDDFSYFEKRTDFIKMFKKETKKARSFLIINYSNPPKDLYMDSEFKPIKWMDDEDK